MKNMKTWIAATCIMAAGLTACKNDRGDDHHYDTTTVASAPVPYEGQSSSTTQAVSDSMTAPDSTSLEYSPNAGTAKDDRKPKMSRKGRVILASYRNTNSNEKIAADREGVYNRAEVMPSYPGGETALRKFIEENIEYPQRAMDNDAEGTVTLYFAVDEQGTIYTPTVISSKIGYGLEEESMRVVNKMPKWNPGQIKGRNVKTRFTLPITYQIQ
jgi:TonB family protein